MYAVMRFNKLKTMGQVSSRGAHNERTRDTPNADGARRHENERLAGTGDWQADVQDRLDDAPTIRSNAVLALDFVFTASRDFFADGDPARVSAWRDRTMDWLRDRFGAENVVGAILHRDELTPHIQAMVVPIDERGKLAAKTFIGTPSKVSEMQTTYAAAVRDLGLERGVKGSVAEHQTVREFYAKIERPTPAPEIVREGVTVDKPGRIVGNPERWAAEQTERIVADLVPTLDDALTKAAHYEGQAATAEANITVLQQRVREVERDYTALAAQVRVLDLRDVIAGLGGERDRHDPHKWRLDGEHISINGDKFYNHDRRQGGGGAIDLVMYATGYDFKQAIAHLNHEAGPDLAVAAAAQHGARQASRLAEAVIERGERVPFMAPAPDEARWAQVRAYLVDARGLSARTVDALHERGDIYADSRSNAVFARRDENRAIVGASLRGTLPGSEFKGLARGSQREEGHFSFAVTIGKPDPHDTPQYYVVESPIDALSRAALLQAGETGRHVFISNDGHGTPPTRQIDEALTNRGLVRCGFDNDHGGGALWAQVRAAYPDAENIERERPPTGAKDWNDALRAELGRGQGQEGTRASARGRELGRQDADHDR